MSSVQWVTVSMQVSTAAVDLIPLFLGTSLDFHIDEEDLILLCPSSPQEELYGQSRVIIQHAPTGIIVESSGTKMLRIRFGMLPLGSHIYQVKTPLRMILPQLLAENQKPAHLENH